MILVNLKQNYAWIWHQDERTAGKGVLCYNNKFYQEENILSIPLCWESTDQWFEGLKDANGFFSILKKESNKLLAAVDRVRSIPLYYGKKDGKFYISDDAYWILKQVEDKEYDEIAETEFLLTGYVTGSNTLYPNVKQMQAGEMLIVENSDEGIWFETKKYYQYFHNNHIKDIKEQDLYPVFDNLLVNVFERLTKMANGRTLLVPLSGGYDSRLVALLLKRLGYENVITFSYGRPGNKETQISKKIAKRLGYKWLFVPYDNELWYKLVDTKQWKEYFEMADGLSSLPHVQDLPAIIKLKEKGIIPNDCIFVPGHSADLLSGSRSVNNPNLYKIKDNKEIRVAINSILDYHYSLWDWTYKHKNFYPVFVQNILNSIGDIKKFPYVASAFESWDVKERQAKYIINSVRVYEFNGYKWWLPFWDKEFMEFWSEVPIEYRVRQKFYKNYVDNLHNKICGTKKLNNENYKKDIYIIKGNALNKMNNFFHFIRVNKILKKNFLYKCYIYNTHPLAYYGIISKSDFKRLYTGKEKIMSFLVKKYLYNKI